jgi:hypothetical protein
MAPKGRIKNNTNVKNSQNNTNVKSIKAILSSNQYDSDTVNDVSAKIVEKTANESLTAGVGNHPIEPIVTINSNVNIYSMLSDEEELSEAPRRESEIPMENSTLLYNVEEQEAFFKAVQTLPEISTGSKPPFSSQSIAKAQQTCPVTVENSTNSAKSHQENISTAYQSHYQSSQNSETGRIRAYPNNFKGRFNVYIRETSKPLSHIRISKHICNKYGANILEIAKVHRYKIRVEAKDAATANKLAEDPELRNQYRVAIPAGEVEVDGVISLTDVDLRDLVDYGTGIFSDPHVPRAQVVDAYRLRKAYTGENGTTEFEDSDLIRVTFLGKALPKKLIIFGLRINVKTFYPKMMSCDKCLGYNHTSKYCTSPTRCAKCGGKHNMTSCVVQEKQCVHCSIVDGHINGEKCPVLKRRAEKLGKNVVRNSKMAYSVIRREYENIVDENPYSSLDECTEAELEETQHNNISYAQMVARPRPKRPRSPKNEKNKSKEPPKKRTMIAESDNLNKPVTEPRARGSLHRATVAQDQLFSASWAGSLKASVFNFVKSFEWPQLWEKIVLDILGQLLDNVLPKISSFVSSFLPSLFRNGQS